MVTIDDLSAARMIAEGALRVDSDTGEATCEGRLVTLPPAEHLRGRPVLVHGSSDGAVGATVDRLEVSGLAVWRVVPT